MAHVTATQASWEWSNLMTKNRTVSQITRPKIYMDTQKRGPFEKEKIMFQTRDFKAYVSFRGYKTFESASGESQVDFE